MATFTDLAPELLSHILKLSTAGGHASEEQRARFRFGLIARAFYLATEGATKFYVDSETKAKALVFKIKQERSEARKAEQGRTTTSTLCGTRFTNIRHLTLVVKSCWESDVVGGLLRATPNLVTLDLDVAALSSDEALSILSTLEVASGLKSLRELQLRTRYFVTKEFLRILVPHHNLEVLSISSRECIKERGEITFAWLRRLRHLRVSIDDCWAGFPDTLFRALAPNPTTELQVLDLGTTPYASLQDVGLNHLLPHVTAVTSFTWTPHPPYNIDNSVGDRVLPLLSAMKSLRYLSISLWETEDLNSGKISINYELFDTVAALPLLHTAIIWAKQGRPDDDRVVDLIKGCQSLRFLSMDIRDGWSRQERGCVEVAAQEAGVVFKYTGPSK